MPKKGATRALTEKKRVQPVGPVDVPYGSALLEFMKMISHRLCGLFVAFVVLGGCGGETEEEDDALVVDDTEAALVENAAEDDDGAPADDGCRDGDHEGHRRHHRHWFKILDLLDGTRDKAVTLAKLPDGTPDGLVAKLTKMDKNGDGIVTKREVKRAVWRHRHHDHDRDD